MGSVEQTFQKPVILLVAFGTTVPEAQAAFRLIDEMTCAAFPDAEIRWAYTSRIVRRRLAAQGTFLDSPEMALARLLDEPRRRVLLLSLHVFPGREFHDLHHNVRLFSKMVKGFQGLRLARPLLASYDDLVRLAGTLAATLPSDRRPDEAVVFVGHGNRAHPADMVYTALGHVLKQLDPRIFVGTIQGRPGVGDLLPELKQAGVQTAWLLPLMAVAGEHARNDMAGDQPGSWRAALAEHGIETRIVLRGLAEIPEVVNLWLDHLRELFSNGSGME